MLTLDRVSYEEFDAACLKQKAASFQQTVGMAKLRETLGWDVHSLVVRDDTTIIGTLLLAGKSGRYEVTMGPLFDFKNEHSTQHLLQAVKEYVKNIGGSLVELYPAEVYQTRKSNGEVMSGPDSTVVELFKSAGWDHKGYIVEYDYVCNRWLFVKDLAGIKTPDELLASYRQTTRQTINKLIKADYSIKKLSYDELQIAKNLIDSSYDKNEVAKRPLSYFQALYQSFGDAIEFLVVYHKGGVPISTGIFIHHPNETVYFMSGADTEHRHLYGGHFLQHTVMSDCVKKGINRYNFYGVSGHFEKNPLLVYKSGFRGEVEEYVGGFRLVVDPVKYKLQKVRNKVGGLARRIGVRK
jgi:lipid II:glycine glycyltransferase (peptidoglycan interpeptide bridge formation enzyme)